jgi:hypothetical protein
MTYWTVVPPLQGEQPVASGAENEPAGQSEQTDEALVLEKVFTSQPKQKERPLTGE